MMTEIPLEILTKYNMNQLSVYKERHGDTVETQVDFYKTFLIVTDYIAAKITEMLVQGVQSAAILEKYGELLSLRQFARDKINAVTAPEVPAQ